jgi:alkaline phosphatase
MMTKYLPSLLFSSILFVFSPNLNAQNFCKENLPTGNVIFIHPDGTGLSTWNATRILYEGPDGELNWDRLTHIGLYQGHTLETLTTSSQAGATTHAYGVKANIESYGMLDGHQVTSLSGVEKSIMQEAKEKGIHTGIINSGTIVEPGTGVFVASDISRSNDEAIAKKIIESETEIILSGGEELLLPAGMQGKHGMGKRKDGLNLIDIAKQNGYYVVFTRDELLSLPDDVEKVLGVFASGHTFNAKSEEELINRNLPNYFPIAPTMAEMTQIAIEILSKKGGNFFLVIEEEGTDNFGNRNNANGTMDALKRADDAIGVALEFYSENKNTLIITAADSDAGAMQVLGHNNMHANIKLPAKDNNGAPYDGILGTATLPFVSAPDKSGIYFPFAIAWSSNGDVFGAVIAKAEGLNSELMSGKIDNSDIYRIMYATLFGKYLE